MMSYEYVQFINEKVMEYLPHDRLRVGDKVNIRCPLCGDSHKSATKKRGWYYMSNASYYCFNCSTGMSGIKFLQFLSGQDYDDIKRDYLKLFARAGFSSGLSSHYEMPDAEPNLFDLKPVVKPSWKKALSAEAKAYLDGRMVTAAPFLREDLYSCQTKKGEYILIPWIVNGIDAYYQLNDYKKLGSLKYVFPKDSRKLLYGLDNIDVTWPYIICFEGVYDSLFVKNAVACGTKSVTEYQAALIAERYPNHQVCVSFDNDEPGITAMTKLIEKGADVKFFKWFDSSTAAKDVNEYVTATKDVNAFSNRKRLEEMIMTPLQMKMWLVQNGIWKGSASSIRRKPYGKDRNVRTSETIDLKSRRSLFE